VKENFLTTPVLFLVFNRPDTTRRVFEEIKKAQPKKLFISADGPRKNFNDDLKLCQATKDIIKEVDWDCEVHTNFREKNLGLKFAMSSGIDWFFKNVKEGIILEDDCLPTQSFFWFCQELLEQYRNDERIMAISGNNFQHGIKRGEASYYFSKILAVWGWASWRRAWRHFDLSLKNFTTFKEQGQIRNVFDDGMSRVFWMTKIQQTFNGGNSWAFPWIFSIFAQNGLCICPRVNLVSNIGFGRAAVHATDPNSLFANMETEDIEEMIHPVFILPDKDADEYFSNLIAQEQLLNVGLVDRIKVDIKTLVKKCMPGKYLDKLRALRQKVK